MITKLFSRMFDAANSQEDELLKQVQADLNTAAKEGKVETEQLSYESSPKEGVINVVDKTNNETTQFVPKDEDGYEMKTDDQSFMIPKLVESIEKLNDKIDKLDDGNKNPGKGVEAPSSAERTNAEEGKPEPKADDDTSKQDTKPEPKKEEKSESAAHPDQKVMLQIDGEYRTGYVIEEQDGGKVKVKIPSMDNAFVTVSKASLSNVSKEEPEKPKRTADEYISFSGRKFVAGGKQRNFAAKGIKYLIAFHKNGRVIVNEYYTGETGGSDAAREVGKFIDKYINDNPGVGLVCKVTDDKREDFDKKIREWKKLYGNFNSESKHRNFSIKGKQRNFSTGTYAIFVDFGNAKQEPYAKAGNPFNIKEKEKCLEDGFKSLDEANAYINEHQQELRDKIKQVQKKYLKG